MTLSKGTWKAPQRLNVKNRWLKSLGCILFRHSPVQHKTIPGIQICNRCYSVKDGR